MNPAIPLSNLFIPNFRKVDEHLFAGGQPQIPEGIADLPRYGIQIVLNLRCGDQSAERKVCDDAGLLFIQIPMPGVEIITDPSNAQLGDAEAVIHDAPGPVFVHCAHGADRTGAVVGIYRISQGATPKEALAEMKRFHNAWYEFGFRNAIIEYFKKRSEQSK